MPSAAFDSEEALLPPASAPAILHDPEVFSALRSEAHRSNRMVVRFLAVGVGGLLAASGVVKDAVAIVE